jgi:hypothetical protein
MFHTDTHHNENNHFSGNTTTDTASEAGAAEAEAPPFFLKYEDAECADWLATDQGGTQALTLPPVMARLCGFGDDLFLHTVLRLAMPTKAGLDLLFAPQVLARMAAVPQATYEALFLPCARQHLGFAADAYWEQVQTSQRPESPPEDSAVPEGGEAAHLAPGAAMATLAAIESDEQFCDELVDWVRATPTCRANPMVLEDAGVLARLCTLPDYRFTPTILALAATDCLGLDILFDERLLPRLARMRRGHLRGTFLPYARQLPRFAEHDFLRVLRETQQTLKATGAQGGTPAVVTMRTVERQPITWLWYPYLALGKLAIFDGDPGTGKSLTVANLAARLSQGHPLPDQEGRPTFPTGTKHATLLLANEDGLADTLKGRLEDAGADCDQIHVLTGWTDAGGDDHLFSFQDMPILEKAIAQYHPRLVVIDPVQAYLGAGVDMHRANETRPLLDGLRRLAEQYQCAIVCIRHMAKSHQGGKAMHRGLGSIDFIGAARTGLLVEQHPNDPTKVLLAQTKSNIGPLGRTQIFSKAHGQFEWCGTSRLTAEMLAGSGRGPDPCAFLDACLWLEDRLGDGLPKRATDLEDEATEEGLSSSTLRRAKKALGIQSRKDGDVWYWRLRAPLAVPLPTLLLSLASLGPLEHVQPHQAVSGGTEAPCTCQQGHGLPPLREPGGEPVPEEDTAPAFQAEVIENMEDVQETQEAQEPEETPPTPTPSAPAGGRKCPHCTKPTTWVLRGGIPFCAKCRTPDLRAR